MAKPLIPADTIYVRAMELLDSEGLPALSAQRLVKDLRISTKTLYQQVGNREQLIRALVARHFSQLELEFEERDTWEKTAMQWCQALHDALRAHPHLTQLMMVDDRKAVTDYVDQLFKATLREGVPKRIALQSCRALANVTINHSLVEVRALNDPNRTQETVDEVVKIEQSFPITVRWILAGVRADVAASLNTR